MYPSRDADAPDYVPRSAARLSPLPFEFVVDGPPVSAQARRRQRVRDWTETVRQEALKYWPAGENPAMGAIRLEIVYLYEGTAADVDNIIKPIQDALKGLVYADDEQVTDVVSRKRNLDANLRVSDPSEVLADGFDREREFLYIVVREAPDQGRL